MTEDQLAKASISYYVDSASGESPADPVALADGERTAKASLAVLRASLQVV